MARWERAFAILRQTVPEGECVLDIGCSAGYGTAKMAHYYEMFGIDASDAHIAYARSHVPQARFEVGSAARLPYPDGHFAAAVMLDVLEHLPNEREALAEVARVLRPDGILVLSVPNTGLLRWLDSNNLYAWLTGEDSLSPPGTAWDRSSFHRHYSLGALRGLLEGQFRVETVHYTGLGIAELVRLPLALLSKRILRSQRLFRTLMFAYIGAYIAEDVVPFNKWGYHLMVVAPRLSTDNL